MKIDVIKQDELEAKPVTSIPVAYEYLKRYSDSDTEMFIVMTLDGSNYPISCHIASKGLTNKALVHAREVFRQAILDNACRVIIAHNHTSRTLIPSKDDLVTTSKLASAGGVLGIQVVDHIILGKNGYISFVEEGYLENNSGQWVVPSRLIDDYDSIFNKKTVRITRREVA